MAEQFQFSPEALAQIEAARLASANGGTYNALDSRYLPSQPGTLSQLDPLYGYAQTAPVLSLTGNKEHESLNFQALPDTSYRLVVGGEVVGTASTPEEVAQLVERANQFSEEGGKKASVKVEKQLPYSLAGETEQRFVPVYENNPNGTGLLEVVIPAALAAMSGGVLGPILGPAFGVSGAVGTGLASGLGSIAGSLATGSSLGDALKKGAITGITAGGLSGLGAFGDAGSSLTDKISGTLAENVAQLGSNPLGLSAAFQAARGIGGSLLPGLSSGAGSILGSAAPVIGDDVISVLANSLRSGSNVAGAAGGALGTAIAPALTSGGGYQAQPGDSPMVTGVGYRYPTSGLLSNTGSVIGSGLGAIGNALTNPPPSAYEPLPGETVGAEQVVDITRNQPPIINLPPVIPTYTPPSPSGETFEPEITVTRDPYTGQLIIPPAIPSPPPSELSLFPAVPPLVVPPTTLPPTTQPRTLSDYINMVRGGLGVVGGIGSLLGGGGDTGGALPPGFNANAGTVNYTPLARTQNVTPFDPFTYGQATGERSFFNPYELQYQTNVPTTPAPAFKDGGEAEFDDSIEGHLASYYSGGGHAGPGPVKGIGSGQEDKIPAWLSDGEYVWSAQDVADLGDGSTNEGVRRLDKMRQMVRKGAGRKDTKSIARPQKGIDSMLKAVGGAA